MYSGIFVSVLTLQVVGGALGETMQGEQDGRSAAGGRGASSPGVSDARSLVHASLWGSISTISSNAATQGFPFSNIVSFADGAVGAGTGIPYMFVSPLDESITDLLKDPRMSLALTAAQLGNQSNSNCAIAAGGDPESPPCTRLTLTGRFVNITGTAEAKVAEAGLYSRHPLMKEWATLGDFFFAKIELAQVWLIDHYGGAARIPVQDYLEFKA
jgi:hypothetical protein